MNRRHFLETLGGCSLNAFAAGSAQPNVLFVAVDDMRDWTTTLGGYKGTVFTPSQERLAAQGMMFTNAHCASPVCNPSRTSILLGMRPSTTGVYGNEQWWRPSHPNAVTLPMHFKANGYHVAGGGKLFHHTAGFNPPDQWDEYFPQVFDDPWFRTNRALYPQVKPEPFPPGFPRNRIRTDKGNEFDWGVLDKSEAEFGDVMLRDWATKFLKRKFDRPFFLGVGFFHPHLPWYVPQRFRDMYPLDKIRTPEVRDDDLADVPPEGQALAKARSEDFRKIVENGQWKTAIQAYLASITFADEQLGRLLDALAASAYAANTIIVLWSDHGYHLGEKGHWHKFTLWEAATRVPFAIGAPGVTKPGVPCSRPVSLLDIYPTLIDLCGLPHRAELDGQSLIPLLRDPARPWERPAITTAGRGQHAARSDRWRYIRYSDGTEELYDHQHDPQEWTNLAGRPELAKVKLEHKRWLPTSEAPSVPGKGSYHFDPSKYTWGPGK